MKKEDKLIEKVTKKLVDDGKIIEAGWAAFKIIVIPARASAAQLDDMRCAFFAGAQHLFGSMIILNSDGEPTDSIMPRMSQISAELNTFITEFREKHGLK